MIMIKVKHDYDKTWFHILSIRSFSNSTLNGPILMLMAIWNQLLCSSLEEDVQKNLMNELNQMCGAYKFKNLDWFTILPMTDMTFW